METTTLEFRAKETEAIETLRTAYTPESGNGGFNPFPYFIFLLAILAIAWGMGAFGGGTPTTPQTETETTASEEITAKHHHYYSDDDFKKAREFLSDPHKRLLFEYQCAARRVFAHNKKMYDKFRRVIKKDGNPFLDAKHMAQYILDHCGALPEGFITKTQAFELGWRKAKNNLHKVAPGKAMGGNVYNNFAKKLPEKAGRKWKELDLGYIKGQRNDQRLFYSNDGLFYRTKDHGRNMEKLNMNAPGPNCQNGVFQNF